MVVPQGRHGTIREQVPDRRRAVAELTKEGLTNVAVANVLGVDESTVRDDKKTHGKIGESRPGRI